MQNKNEFKNKNPATSEDRPHSVSRIDDAVFEKKLSNLIAEAEETRLNRMKSLRSRSVIGLNLNILFIFLGVLGFGWYFLVDIKPILAVICLIVSFTPSIFIHFWSKAPLKTYIKEHKTIFMPKLAEALHGLRYHEQRGVSAKILERLAVIPAHDRYEAEDCFMGKYKGIDIILSEARLYSKTNKQAPVFEGLFILLELPSAPIEGHTIITANHKMVKAYATTRWKTMQKTHISVSNPDWNLFEVYSTKPETAELMVGERLIKELAEAAIIFNKSPLTAVLFGKKYVFMMIPHDQDMFEASDIHTPVTTKQQAAKTKKEIEQLLEVIDVFDLYKPVI